MDEQKELHKNLSDVWAPAQVLRSSAIVSFVRRAWRQFSHGGARTLQILVIRILRREHAALRRPSSPSRSKSLPAIVAAFVLVHLFAGAMLINSAVAVVKSAQSETQQSVAASSPPATTLLFAGGSLTLRAANAAERDPPTQTTCHDHDIGADRWVRLRLVKRRGSRHC